MADIDLKKMKEEILSLGAFRAGIVSVSDIVTDESFRALCESNSCGMFGKCWTCPPDVGSIGSLIASLKNYEDALVYQKVYPLEDSFDFEGMTQAKTDFSKFVQSVKKRFPGKAFLHLGAGGCGVCERGCSRTENKPCRFPDLAVASLESYGINVSKLALSAGMKYINGKNTVTYFGAVLY